MNTLKQIFPNEVINRMSKLYSFRKIQRFPVEQEKLWEFISSPINLKLITPPYMGFDIVSDLNHDKMYPGQIIAYKVRPLAGIAFDWVTEITHVKEGEYFVDEQRFGPYSFWHHQHFLSEMEGGVEMVDIVNYKIPGWLFGDVAQQWMVKPKLEEIFNYREKVLEGLFGKMMA